MHRARDHGCAITIACACIKFIKHRNEYFSMELEDTIAVDETSCSSSRYLSHILSLTIFTIIPPLFMFYWKEIFSKDYNKTPFLKDIFSRTKGRRHSVKDISACYRFGPIISPQSSIYMVYY